MEKLQLEKSGLVEMSDDEMLAVDGGSWLNLLVFVVSAIVGYIIAENL